MIRIRIIQTILIFSISVTFVWSAFSQNARESDSLKTLLKNSKADTSRVSILIKLSEILMLDDHKSAVDYALEAVRLSDRLSNDAQHCYALRIATKAYFYAGLNDQAAYFNTKHTELAKVLNNEGELGLAYLSHGGIRMSISYNDTTAEYYILKAAEQFKKLSAKQNGKLNEALPALYNNLGIIFREKEELAKANDYTRLGINLARKMNSSNDLIRLLNNQGWLLLRYDSTAEALEFFDEAVNLSKKEASLLYASSLYGKGLWYEKVGDTINALSNYRTALKIAIERESNSNISFFAKKISEVYNSIGKPDSAFIYQTKHINYTEKLKSIEAVEELTRQDLLAEFNNYKESAEREESNRKMLTAFIAIISIVIIILVVLKNFRIRKSFESKLRLYKLEKEFLRKQQEEKEKKLITKSIEDIQRNQVVLGISKRLREETQLMNPNERQVMENLIIELEEVKDIRVSHEFEIGFEQISLGFYERLNKIASNLSPNERKLCAFLKLNMSSKEISLITNQSVQSIKMARVRLRKKLKLTNSTKGLVEFLASI